MKIKNANNDIFIWSPMTSHVGTIMATLGMIKSLNRFSNLNNKIYLLNVLGEFNNFDTTKDYYLINIFNRLKLPKTGIISKIAIYFFTLLTFPILLYLVKKYQPKVIITCLVGYLPCLLKIFFKNLRIVNSIQGFPKLNNLRKFLWNRTYKKSDCLVTMTNITRNFLIRNLDLNENKVVKIDNPIISKKMRILSFEKIDKEDLFIFEKKVFCSIGRLTRQKNYLELIKAFENFSKKNSNNTNLIILGKGEDEKILKDYIIEKKINNCFLLGFKKNPYKYLSNSSLYISSSLWEEPGHTLIEAGYLNVPILTSDCPNGPREMIIHNKNGFKYKMKNIEDLEYKLTEISKLSNKELFKVKLNMKKTISSFTEYQFSKKIKNYL